MIFNKLGDNTDIVTESGLSTQDSSDILGIILTENVSDEEMEEFMDDSDELETVAEEGLLTEATIVKLDKKAKFKRAQLAAMFKLARQKGDKKMKLLMLLWKKEKPLLDYIKKKYSNAAAKEVKKSMAAGSKSNSKVVKKAIKRANASLNQK